MIIIFIILIIVIIIVTIITLSNIAFDIFFFAKWNCLRKKIYEMKMTTTGKWMNEKKRFFSIFSNDYSSILFCLQYSRMHWSDRNNSNDSNNYRLGHWRKTRFLLNIFFLWIFFGKLIYWQYFAVLLVSYDMGK